MFAHTAGQLLKMIQQHPESSPSTFLKDETLAAYLYDTWPLGELQAAFNRDADPEELSRWNLTESEWRTNVEMAIIALTRQ